MSSVYNDDVFSKPDENTRQHVISYVAQLLPTGARRE